MTAVLLLNGDYQPIRVMELLSAARLMLRGCVDPVPCEDGEIAVAGTIHSTSQALDIPQVIRLRRYIKAPKRGATWSSRGVKMRDHYTCVYCGAKAGDRHGNSVYTHSDFTVDHVIPKSQGGQNTWINTACACTKCNNRKGNRTPNEAGMKMLWSPATPRVGYFVLSGDVPQAWKVYIQTK